MAKVQKELADGTSSLWEGPYEMPYATVQSYRDRELKRRRGTEITPLAKGDPNHAVSILARRLLSLTEKAIEREEKAKTPDLDSLKRAADLLAKTLPLIAKKPTATAHSRVSDPLTEALTTKGTEETTLPTWANGNTSSPAPEQAS